MQNMYPDALSPLFLIRKFSQLCVNLSLWFEWHYVAVFSFAALLSVPAGQLYASPWLLPLPPRISPRQFPHSMPAHCHPMFQVQNPDKRGKKIFFFHLTEFPSDTCVNFPTFLATWVSYTRLGEYAKRGSN